METLLARYQADGADFLDGNPKLLLPDLCYLGDFRGSAVYGFFAASRFFLVDAPGGRGLVEFVDSRLRQLGRKPEAPAAVLLTACGAEETAGLPELVAKYHCQVIASPAGLAGLRDSCPPGTVLIPAEELPDKGWFPVSLMELGGRGVAPIAYRITVAGKTVLFSGRIPVRMSQESGDRLIADLTRSPGDLLGYFTSLTQLPRPQVPTSGSRPLRSTARTRTSTIVSGLETLRRISPCSRRSFQSHGEDEDSPGCPHGCGQCRHPTMRRMLPRNPG